jgi:NAD(P)-dependent dehydrogenase (short-subunit alcohol dehydrogenase family)
VHPGLIKTHMGDHFLQNFVDLGLVKTTADSEAAFLKSIPMGFWGQPQDIAAAMVYLASDASRYVTGTEIIVDGGIFAS